MFLQKKLWGGHGLESGKKKSNLARVNAPNGCTRPYKKHDTHPLPHTHIDIDTKKKRTKKKKEMIPEGIEPSIFGTGIRRVAIAPWNHLLEWLSTHRVLLFDFEFLFKRNKKGRYGNRTRDLLHPKQESYH
jgi:hypothetical protein